MFVSFMWMFQKRNLLKAGAVFFGLEGAPRGPNAIKPVFESTFAEFAKPGASVARKQRLIEGEYAYIVWTSETADNSYELASHTFIIQNGSIRMQAFTAKVKPKSVGAKPASHMA